MSDSLHHLLMLITHFGDSGLLSVLSLFCALYLYASGNRRAAAALSGALLLCIGAMGFLKIYFLGCHHLFPSLGIRSPSGHAAMGVAIYGTLALIAMKRLTGAWRWVPPLAAALLAGAIAASRVALGAHSVNEVLLALGVGGAIVALSYVVIRPVNYVSFRARYLVLVCLVAIALLYGSHAPAEVFLNRLTALLKANLPFCV